MLIMFLSLFRLFLDFLMEKEDRVDSSMSLKEDAISPWPMENMEFHETSSLSSCITEFET